MMLDMTRQCIQERHSTRTRELKISRIMYERERRRVDKKKPAGSQNAIGASVRGRYMERARMLSTRVICEKARLKYVRTRLINGVSRLGFSR